MSANDRRRRILQMRLVVETPDHDAGRATLELSTPSRSTSSTTSRSAAA